MFGASLHDDILTDISATRMTPLLASAALAHAAALTLRIGYLLSLTGSFILLLFPLRHVLADVLLSGHDALASRWLPVTFGLTVTAYLTACFLPSIWGALSLVGATAATTQAWIIPSLVIMALDRMQGAGAGGGGVIAGAHGTADDAGGGRGLLWRAGRLVLSGVILVVGVAMFFNAILDAVVKRLFA